MDQRLIYSDIQTALPSVTNQKAHALAGIIWEKVRKYGIFMEKEGGKSVTKPNGKKVRLSPEERAQETADLLDEKLVSREISAAELRELKDIFNLKAKDQDIAIESVDYSMVDPETFDVISAVGEMIRRANATADITS